MIKNFFKKKTEQSIENKYDYIFEPEYIIVPDKSLYSKMACEKYGYIGRGVAPYYFFYQNLHFTGTGIIICRCDKIKELNFEILCSDKLDLTCEKSPDYITTFFMNGEIIQSCRYDPDELVVYYDPSLNCKKSTSFMVDH